MMLLNRAVIVPFICNPFRHIFFSLSKKLCMDKKISEPLPGTLPKDEEQNILKENNPNDDEEVLKNNPDYKEEAAKSNNSNSNSKNRDKNNDTLGIP
jgi:hypothetical protein